MWSCCVKMCIRDRLYDVGIAEGHAVAMCAGMAKQGMLPVFAVYSTFLQRSYDMLLHDVALQQLHVVFGVDRAGLVGADGAVSYTHLSAGQLIDRTGKLLGIPFPAGKALDALAAESDSTDSFSVKLRELSFSLSGVENQVKQRLERGVPAADVARFALNTVVRLIRRVTERAQKEYPGLPVLFSGGVASNALLRREMGEQVLFAEPRYSTDNAMGVDVYKRQGGQSVRIGAPTLCAGAGAGAGHRHGRNRACLLYTSVVYTGPDALL